MEMHLGLLNALNLLPVSRISLSTSRQCVPVILTVPI